MRRRRGLSEEEKRLWAGVARQAKPLKGKAVPDAVAEPDAPTSAPRSLSRGAMAKRLGKIAAAVLPSPGPGLAPSRGVPIPPGGREIDPVSMASLLDGISEFAPASTRGISPLGAEMPPRRKGPVRGDDAALAKATLMPAYQAAAPGKAIPSLHPIEKPVKRKIAAGRVAIDGRIDLHDMTQIVAHYALLGFLRQAQATGFRHVLVITGRGASFGSRGVIKRALPHWFGTPEFRALVAGFEPADRHHGGDGAFYVRVRRR